MIGPHFLGHLATASLLIPSLYICLGPWYLESLSHPLVVLPQLTAQRRGQLQPLRSRPAHLGSPGRTPDLLQGGGHTDRGDRPYSLPRPFQKVCWGPRTLGLGSLAALWMLHVEP